MSKKRVLLAILDGWGHGLKPEVSAIAQANTPFVDSLYKKYPNSALITFGNLVGLPKGQMGNSEVGHINIGAGRVVYQELARINKSISDNELAQNPILQKAIRTAKEKGVALHLMGLVSDGGVHAHINHLKALCDICENAGLDNVFVHAFLDGRDTAPKSGMGYLNDFLTHIKGKKTKLATVVGRYFAMDRDNRWERIKLAYDLLVKGKGEGSKDILATIQNCYDNNETDEFIQPIYCQNENNEPVARLKEGDVLLCFNFRTDRPREISTVLTQEDMPEQGMQKLNLHYFTMTSYDERFKNVNILFEKDNLSNTLGEVLEKAGKTQVRIAETEKYAHVTFFFSGGREKEFEGERRLLVPSPKVATYDLEPKMSAEKITNAIVTDIQNNQPDFICLNYANTDMVGHTGVFEAAKIAAETVDTCVKRLVNTALEYNYEIIIIADHGNADYMINEDGTPHTAHTTNLVPFIFVSKHIENVNVKDGKLGDIAPTVLHLMEVECPAEMDGEILVENII